MLRLLVANKSSYTELVCIVPLLQRKANWQEKKALFLASFPHLHSRRQSCFKPSNYPQFITVMTIEKGKAKKSFWIGLTSKEGGSCQRYCTQTYKSPMGVEKVPTSLLLLTQGSDFCLVSWSHPCTAYPSDAYTCPRQCCGTCPSSWPQGWHPVGQQTLHSISSSPAWHSSVWQSMGSCLPSPRMRATQ